MADHHLEHRASDKNFDSPSSSKPYVLMGGLMGGIVGIGALVLILVQSIEITVEPGDRIDDPAVTSVPEAVLDDAATGVRESGPDDGDQSSASPDVPSSQVPTESAISGSDSPLDAQPEAGDQVGTLRVSNQTSHPIRVALLPQQGDAAAEAESGQVLIYGEPVHWDFAPSEGASQGLVLALPDQTLMLRSGDIVTAFAQDGSQRYWGPFVVGATAFPRWDNQDSEWMLVLRDGS